MSASGMMAVILSASSGMARATTDAGYGPCSSIACGGGVVEIATADKPYC